MYKVKSCSEYNHLAKEIKCGTVYPLSMTQGYQSGDIYTDGKSILFHHDCGFAFMCGDIDEAFLCDVYSLMKKAERRFVLFSEKEYVTHFYEKKSDIKISTRYFYEYILLTKGYYAGSTVIICCSELCAKKQTGRDLEMKFLPVLLIAAV